MIGYCLFLILSIIPYTVRSSNTYVCDILEINTWFDTITGDVKHEVLCWTYTDRLKHYQVTRIYYITKLSASKIFVIENRWFFTHNDGLNRCSVSAKYYIYTKTRESRFVLLNDKSPELVDVD